MIEARSQLENHPLLEGSVAAKRNLFGYVVQELGQRIVRGDLKPGDTLPNEAELGRELGVSRSVLREAVKSLAAKGLLESQTRTGTRVRAAIHWNILDRDVLGWRYATMPRTAFLRELFEVRQMIEPAAAELAAARATAEDLATLEQACARMEAADVESDDAIIADLSYHRAVLAASHNELLLQMGGLIGVGLLTSFRISSRSYDVFLPLHRQVVDAIRAGQGAAARRLMEGLLSRTVEFIRRELDAEPAAGPEASRAGRS